MMKTASLRQSALAILLGLAAVITALTVLLALPTQSQAEEGTFVPPSFQRERVNAAANWLLTQQNSDGGFASSFSTVTQTDKFPSDAGGTVEAIIALGTSGVSLSDPYLGKSKSPADWLDANADKLASYAASNGGNAGKVVQALSLANRDAYSFDGYNFVMSITNQLSTTGKFQNVFGPYGQAQAIFGLQTVSETVPASAIAWLTNTQTVTGYFGAGLDDTAAAIMVLVQEGYPKYHPVFTAAKTYLANEQLVNAGWKNNYDTDDISASSTALVFQALQALEEDLSEIGPWAKGSEKPLNALLDAQQTDGSFVFFGATNRYATQQGIAGIAGNPFPLNSRYETARSGLACLDDIQDPTTAGWFEQYLVGLADAGSTAHGLNALAAMNQNPYNDRWTVGGPGGSTPVSALESLTHDYLKEGRGGHVGEVMIGVAAVRVFSPSYTVTNFAGYNLPVSATAYLSPTGQYDNDVTGHALTMIGLLQNGFQPDALAVTWLKNAQQPNGGWGDLEGTALALQALGRMGETNNAGVDYLRGQQKFDASWESNVYLTALVLQALTWQKENPYSTDWSVVYVGKVINGGHYLAWNQLSNGCFASGRAATNVQSASVAAVIASQAQTPGWNIQYNYLPLVIKGS